MHERRARRGCFLLTLILGSGLMTVPLAAQVPVPPVPVFQLPFTGESEPGIPFPLPQRLLPSGRRAEVGASNALAVSWDGRLLMYWDSGNPLWAGRPFGTQPRGFIFATFDPSLIQLDPDGRPDFSPCFGTPFPRFAETSRTLDPGDPPSYPGNDYPSFPGYTDYYPYLPPAGSSTIGGMGEIGLLLTQFLSNIMYPVPDAELPAGAHGANPFASDASGAPLIGGAFSTYRTYVTLQDIPKFWDDASGQWTGYPASAGFFTPYETGTYPNGHVLSNPNRTMKRNGRIKLDIVVDHANHQIVRVDVLQKWKPFRIKDAGWTTTPNVTVGLSIPAVDEMWADNFEPTLSLDGHLMVAKGNSRIIDFGSGGSRVVFYYNQTPFGESDWQGPWDLHHLYLHRDVDIAGRTLAERYPLARHPIKDYDGDILGDANGDGILTQSEADQVPFEGGYTWLSHDGRFVIYTVQSAGVGTGHPEVGSLVDGGGTSNRGEVSIVGSVTGWQMWRIDHAAVNPSRHMFTAWDQDSRTVHQRTASFGFGPGFWELLRGADGLPLRDDGAVKLQLVNSNRLVYYEVDIEPYQQRDYAFYLPMTVMLDLVHKPSVHDTRREVDITRTPDLSGHANLGYVEGGELPCEYFDLPTAINAEPTVWGLYTGATNPAAIHPSWTAADTILDGAGRHWAPVADFVDGKDADGDGVPDTTPFAGRGDPRDMDSDDCWGKIGQAMFFRESTRVRIDNTGTPALLNPGTAVSGAADELTASLWVNPVQNRTGSTDLLRHHVRIQLLKGVAINGDQQGKIRAGVEDTTGTVHWLASPGNVAPLAQWTHVALIWKDVEAVNASELRLFVGGVEVPNSPLQLPFDRLGTGGQDILIGCLDACATAPDHAVLLLDEVALRNTDLTAPEVANLALLPLPEPAWDNSGLPAAPLPFDNDVDGRVPVTNPYDANVARLGADLFNDVRLSANKTTSCATCHDPTRAFTDGLTTAIGFDGTPLPRNTPTIYNQRFQVHQFWDARALDLEDQALDPIFNPDEMGLDWPTLEAYLEGDADYLANFDLYMGTAGDITQDHVRRAIATYERSITAGDSAADRFEAGTGSLSGTELRGRSLFFGKARCSGCHNGPNLTDGRLWSTGAFLASGADDGAYEESASPATAGRAKFLGAFKTPTLRELTRTGPYFHDGHAPSLAEVVEFYNAGGVRQDGAGHALLDAEHDVTAEEINRRLGLTPGEVADLEAYLVALTGDDVNDGVVGFNQPPSVTITKTLITTGTPPVQAMTLQVDIDVTDPDGQSDIDTSMVWTLDVEVNGDQYDWSSGRVSAIPNGYRLRFKVLPTPGVVTARAADGHGLWSPTVVN